MCLAIPGVIVSLSESDELLRTAKVDFGGVVREVSVATTPEARVGDYLLAHAGIALTLLKPNAAQETLDWLERLAAISEDEGTP